MSDPKTVLPERPSLEHLKKQAKQLLEAARNGEPSALVEIAAVSRERTAARPSLANAQHALAHRYAFSSWSNLREEVLRRQAAHLAREALPSDREQRMDLVDRALEDKDDEALRILLQRDPSLADGWGDRRPLARAAQGDRARAIDLLLDAGAALEPKHGYQHPPFSWAVTTHSFAAAQRLLARGAELDLWCAAGLGMVERLPAFFDEHGQPLPGASRYGTTRFDAQGQVLPKPPLEPRDVVSDALSIASRNGQLEAVRFLLARGGDPGFEGFNRSPALHWAAFSGNRAVVELLLANGADPEQRDGTYGCRYRQFAARNAIEWAWLGALERTLGGDATLANEQDASWGPPLHEAAERGLDEHVETLLLHGADPNALDASGQNALERAARAVDVAARARCIGLLEAARAKSPAGSASPAAKA